MSPGTAEESDHRYGRLLRAHRQEPRGRRAAKCNQQFPPSDGDCHTPLPCEVRKGTVPRHERAVFTSKEGRMLVRRPNKDARDRLHIDVGGTQQFALWATGKTQSDGSNAIENLVRVAPWLKWTHGKRRRT